MRRRAKRIKGINGEKERWGVQWREERGGRDENGKIFTCRSVKAECQVYSQLLKVFGQFEAEERLISKECF